MAKRVKQLTDAEMSKLEREAQAPGLVAEHPASWYVAHIAAVRHALRNA